MNKPPEQHKRIVITPPKANLRTKKNLHVLVVEDSKTQARQMKNLLEKAGFTVAMAENGIAALDLLKSRSIDLVVSDVVMPGMDGYELCRAIRQDAELSSLPVILLTSLSEPEDIFHGLDCGADNFVAKPFDAQYLLNRINFLVLNSELQHKDRVSFGIEVLFGGRRHFVSADRVQILHHLLSTYETATMKTRELEKAQRDLRDLNARLEVAVQERTAALQAEVEERRKAECALAYRLHLDESLVSVSNRFINVSPEELDSAIEASLGEIGEAMAVDAGFLWLIDEKDDRIVKTHLWSQDDVSMFHDRGAAVKREEYSWWFDQMKLETMIATTDVALLPPEANVPDGHTKAIRSILVVPVFSGDDRLMGMLCFSTSRKRQEWFPADVTLVKIVAEVFSKALEHRKVQELSQNQANLLDLATDAIVVRDVDGRLLFWNSGAEKLYGWQREEVLGKTSPRGSGDHPQQFEAARRELLEKGKWRGDTLQVDRHGRELIISEQWTLVRDAEGNPKSVLSIGTDVTEKKALEKNFYQAQKQESIGSLASGIAHDFNNLLAVINGYSEMIIDGPDEDPKRLAAEILLAGHRAESLVRQILAFARKSDADFEPVRVGKILKDLVRVVQETFPKRINIRLDLAADLPEISGDATQIYQILMNLVVNARDSIEQSGKIRITGRLAHPAEAKISAGQDCVCLEVTDTGQGMPPETAARIFDPFFTTKAKGEGTGLGLSVVEGIVKSHGGTVEVHSRVGSGTTFRVFFPAAAARASRAVTKQEQKISRAGEQQLLLVVDDEPAIRDMIQMVLEEHGYQVVTATDGLDAISVLDRETGVDLILADLDMPRANGEALLREVKKRKLQPEFILLSGYLPQERLVDLKKVGLEWHLLKPLSIRELLAKVETVLSSKGGPRADRTDKKSTSGSRQSPTK